MFYLLILVIFTFCHASIWDTLTTNIAVIEFEYIYDEQIPPQERIQANIAKYQSVLENITKNQKFDLVIFPELSLRVTPETSVEFNLNDNPCAENGTFLARLSCEAQKHNIYLVTNLVEKVKCDKKTARSENCRKLGYYYYNTNVIFDRQGNIAHRYRKYNLFGEPGLDRSEKPELVIFKTDFGVTFATFTCFDILFQKPAQIVVRQEIDGIIYPTNWHSQLPFLTALQVQQMFAYENDIVLFAAGGNQPIGATGGSGVYFGKEMLMEEFIPEGGTRTLIYSSVNGEVAVSPERSDDELALEMDGYPFWSDDSLPLYESRLLDVTRQTISEQICSTNETTLCCNFSIKLTTQPLSGNFYSYMMIAYSGFRHYPNISDGLLEVCGLVACLNSSISSCGLRFPNYREVDWPISFDEIVIEANFEISENKTQFPNSLKSSIRPIDASETEWESEKVVVEGKEMMKRRFATTKSQNRLMTFAIYGRDFGKDTFPRDEESGNSSGRSRNQIATFLIIIFICIFKFIL